MPSRSKQHRVAFYPCCACDFLDPLQLLGEFVDEVVFCDRLPSISASLAGAKAKGLVPAAPASRCLSVPWRSALSDLKCVDVLFYRNDSEGEGGSGDSPLALAALPLILNLMPMDGLIITDCKYDPDKVFSHLRHARNVRVGIWELTLLPEMLHENHLHVFQLNIRP